MTRSTIARPAAAAQPVPSARLVYVTDLRMARGDVELWPRSAASAVARKVLASARLVGSEQRASGAVVGQ